MTNKKEKQLVVDIKKDPNLSSEDKMFYSALADLYLTDLARNLSLTSLTLSKNYDIASMDEWRSFLLLPVVKKYIKDLKAEQIMAVADAGLMGGDKNAAAIKKVAEAHNQGGVNNKIVLMRLPEREDFDTVVQEVSLKDWGI